MSVLGIFVSTRIAAGVIVSVGLKGTLVVVVAALLNRALRGRSASLRYRVWVAAILALAVLPVFDLVSPEWRAAVETGWHYPGETALIGQEALETRAEPPSGVAASPAGLGATLPTDPPAPPPTLPLASMVLVVWWIGVIVMTTRVSADVLRASLLRWGGRPVPPEDPVAQLLDRERRRIGIGRSVELMLTEERGLAATVGVWRPAILLGPDVAAMPTAELRSVLLHELAHIRRNDFLTVVLTSLAAAIAWTNPLTWWARRRAQHEREQACDDRVLAQGVPAAEYARVLLGFAVSRHAVSPAMRGSVGLRFSSTKERLHAVLDSGTERGPVGRASATLVVAAFVVVSLALGGAELLSATPGTGTTRDLIEALADVDSAVRARAARTLGRRDPAPARPDLEALLDDPSADVRLAAIGALERLGDPASLEAVARVLERPFDGGRGEHGFVLKLAMLTLGRIDTPASAAVLVHQLDRPVPQLRWLALQTLLSMPAHCTLAVEHLERFAASDPDPRNRSLAAAALERARAS